jgi:atypical dual specificity phosphatase
MINFNPIDQFIFIGSTPQNEMDVARLAQMKVSAVLSLQSDVDLKQHRIDWKKLQAEYNARNITVARFPIMDFDEDDLGNKIAAPIQQLKQYLDVGHRVYVHCNAGICRASSTVLGYYMAYKGMSFDQGLAFIRTHRPQVNPYKNAVLKGVKALSENT